MKKWALIGCVWVLYMTLGIAMFGPYADSQVFAFSIPATTLTAFLWGRASKKWGL